MDAFEKSTYITTDIFRLLSGIINKKDKAFIWISLLSSRLRCWFHRFPAQTYEYSNLYYAVFINIKLAWCQCFPKLLFRNHIFHFTYTFAVIINSCMSILNFFCFIILLYFRHEPDASGLWLRSRSRIGAVPSNWSQDNLYAYKTP